MTEDVPISELARRIYRHLDGPDAEISSASRAAASREALLTAVAERVAVLLEGDLRRLLHLLYQMDLPERQVWEALDAGPPPAIATRLASLMLERVRRSVVEGRRFEAGDDSD